MVHNEASMKSNLQVESCLAYLQSSAAGGREGDKAHRGPVVTISRQCGARGTSIARVVATILQGDRFFAKGRPWTVFDQNLLQYLIDEHQLPERTAAFFSEDRDPQRIRTVIGEILGLHPGVFNTHARTAEAIRHLAEEGNIVFVGRGANFITADIHHAVHVRLVGSEAVRVQHVARREGLNAAKAAEMVRHIDHARDHYVRSVFRKDIGDPLHYDLFINTDHFTDGAAADLIVTTLRGRIAAL
jgi:cytidylate kinase